MGSGVFAILICALVLNCNALNCRTDGGPKEDDLKSVFMTCVKKMGGKSNENSRQGSFAGISKDQDYDDRTMKGNKRNEDDGMHKRNDGMNRRDDIMNRRDDSLSRGQDSMIRRDDSMRNRGEMNDGSSQSDESTSEYPIVGYRSTASPSPRRHRRADGLRNSGHRSQYNPNMPQRSDMIGDGRNGSSANMTAAGEKSRSCVIHCFLQDLEMTGDNGMPDRYMVTNVITKDVKNEDLKDFLQESVEECFQILYNENTQDKCEFSKNLMMCLSEKGRSNCDDWKEDSLHF